MLYIFDLGNVIVDIDFNRVLGVWSDLGRVPLALLKAAFRWAKTSSVMNVAKSAMSSSPRIFALNLISR